jgi:two-component system nitrate/nitrite response regulator NarL
MSQLARVFIVEDHVCLGDVVGRTLRERGFLTRLCSAGTAAEVEAAAAAFRPDVVLLDLGLWPEITDSVDLIIPLSRDGARVIVLTGSDDRLLHARALSAGAVGVVPKQRPFEETIAALHSAIEGRPINPRTEVEELLADMRSASANEADRYALLASLTHRESVVLGLLMEGLQARDIAEREYVSLATVRSQIHSVLVKLDVHSQLAAVAKARELGWGPDTGLRVAL